MYKIIYTLALAIACSAVPLEDNKESNRISNGNYASNIQFPYAVSQQLITNNQAVATRGHRCGGALVTFSHVLTAASCMFEWTADWNRYPITISNYRYFAGASMLTNDTSAERVRTIAQYTVHPDYLGIPSYANDIAVVTLATPFANGTTTIVPISLPSSSFNPADFTSCTVAGWGQPSYTSVLLASTELKYNNKYVYNQNLCTNVYNTQYGIANILPSMVCAASYDIVSSGCVGDEGNALICGNTLTGVLALHGNCGASSYPELYTRVSNYTTWILGITSSAGTFSPGASVLIFLTIMQISFVSLLS